MNNRDIRAIFLYEFKLGRNATQAAHNINEAFGEDTANERTVQRWFAKFRSGDMSLENEERGRPETVIDNDHLKALIEADTRITVRELATDLNVSIGTISQHIKAIGKVKKLDKWIPHELNEKQKNRRMEVCSALLLRNKNDPFLHRIVTCDEKWILYDNRRRSAQWLDAGAAPEHMPKPSLHPKKTMVTVWWSAAGVIHYSFLKPGETITAEKYCREIEVFHQKLSKEQPALVNRKGPILLHDNARPHVSQITLHKLNELNFETLPHPAYSPDLSPTDYHFFKHLDNFLTAKMFAKQATVENAFKEFVESRSPEFYQTGINKLVSRWQKCVDSSGSYFD